MSKRLVRSLSIVLVLSLFFLHSSTVFAASLQQKTTAVALSTSELVLSEENNHVVSIRGEDLSNGDSRFYLLRDNEIVSESYVDRANSQIIYKKYENNVAVTHDVRSYSPPVAVSPMASAGYVSVGAVRYNHYVQGTFMCVNTINWSYSVDTNPYSHCDLNGSYRDLAEFAAAVCGFLGLFTAAAGIAIANKVFTILGLAGGAGAFLIPPYMVDCKRTEVNWKATRGTKTKVYQGARCVVTHPSKENQVVIEGDYYPTTAIADHNDSLALAPYSYLCPGADMYEVESWPV